MQMKPLENFRRNCSQRIQRKETNKMDNLIGKYGSTLWKPPIDEEDAKWYNGGKEAQGHQGLVGKVIKDDGDILTMFCQGRTMRFFKKDFKAYQEPEFEWGDKVLILDKNLEGTICHFTWHFKNKEYFYFVEVNGKRLKKRYYRTDLKKL